MKARIILTRADASLLEAGAEYTREVLVPAAREHEGYRGYVALFDPARGLGMAVTLWEDERTEMLSDDAIRESREQAARDFGVEQWVEKYDVVIADFVEPGSNSGVTPP